MDPRLELHHTRVRNGIGLGRIAALTALHPHIVSRIDEGRFEELPPGIYARAYVRAFAEAVGANPHHALVDLAPFLPAEPDPLPALREHARPSPMDSVRAFLASQAGAPPLRRLVAAGADALVLLGVGAIMVLLAAAMCGISVRLLLERESLALALLFAIPVGLYFALFEWLAAPTPGQALVHPARNQAYRIVVRIAAWSPRPAPPAKVRARNA